MKETTDIRFFLGEYFLFLRICLCFLEREERGGEKHQCASIVASHTHPDQGLNPQTFGAQDDIQPPEPPARAWGSAFQSAGIERYCERPRNCFEEPML